jgi:hypothetical protein
MSLFTDASRVTAIGAISPLTVGSGPLATGPEIQRASSG